MPLGPELEIEGWKFFSTTGSDKYVGNAVEALKENGKATKVENFGVLIQKVDQLTNKVTEWKKIEGYSIWIK